MGLEPLEPVPEPVPGYYPLRTDASRVTLFGRKAEGVDVIEGSREIAVLDDRVYWSVELELAGGENGFTFYSMDRTGRESGRVKVVIERVMSAVAPVVAGGTVSSVVSPVEITGVKEAGSALFVNGLKVVPENDETGFSFRYPVKPGENIVTLFQESGLGIRSEPVSVVVNYDGNYVQPPELVYPLDGRLADRKILVWDGELSGLTSIVELSDRPDFKENLSGFPARVSEKRVSLPFNMAGGRYYWRVGAETGNGNVFYSPVRSFRTGVQDFDSNGDGFSDLVIGAPFKGSEDGPAGWVHLYHGGERMDGVPEFSAAGESRNDQFGHATAWLGDVNGDGFSDLAVSAPEFSAYKRGSRVPTEDDPGLDFFPDSGRVYVYLGGAVLRTMVFTGTPGENLGYAVAGAGDINGDGFDDILISATAGNEATGDEPGRAYLYFGGRDIDNIADVVLTGDNVDDAYGFSVSPAGDYDGDGFDDILVGAPGSDERGDACGKAYLYFGAEDGVRQEPAVAWCPVAGDEFGFTVAGAGDVNGDGFADAAVTALRRSNTEDVARVLIFFGGKDPDFIADMELAGERPVDMFGLNISSLHDINKDGFDDLLIGAPFNDSAGFKTGRAYIYYGGSGLTSPPLVLSGSSVLEFYGASGGYAADVNGDNNIDLTVSAPYNKDITTDAGVVELYLGQPESFPAVPYLTLYEYEPAALFGFDVN